ncbi:MAG: DEAD/DEAH box helicase [Candidatus Margulisiibacteriota bacterium]
MDKVTFSSLPLSSELHRAIEDMGFEEASPIQSQAIPVLLDGLDVLGQSQTGTGKTAAFGIPVLEKIDTSTRKTQALILCPTRELAIQVSEELMKLAKYKRGLNIVPVYGGQPIERQFAALRKGVHVIIGTPGRVMDHMERGTVVLDHINTVVLDEADEMLDMGFRDDIEWILGKTSTERQTVFFSATMAKEILDLTKRYQKDPVTVKVAHTELTVPKIDQCYFEVRSNMKVELLSRLIDVHSLKLALVFCNTKREVDEVVSHLQARGYFADGLHGDMKQGQRDTVMNKFRQGIIDILVATDVAARGIDVDDVEAVFNYDMPQDEETYVHRIGRTGRAGRSGKAFTFASGRDMYRLNDIQRYAKIRLRREAVPTLNEVHEMKRTIFLDKVKATIETEELEKYARMLDALLAQDLNLLDIAAALLKMNMGPEKEVDTLAKAAQESFHDRRGGYQGGGQSYGKKPYGGSGYQGQGGGHRSRQGMTAVRFSIGERDGVRIGDFVGAIAGETGIEGKSIGRITLKHDYTLVDVPSEVVQDVLRVMNQNSVKGRKVTVSL